MQCSNVNATLSEDENVRYLRGPELLNVEADVVVSALHGLHVLQGLAQEVAPHQDPQLSQPMYVHAIGI